MEQHPSTFRTMHFLALFSLIKADETDITISQIYKTGYWRQKKNPAAKQDSDFNLTAD